MITIRDCLNNCSITEAALRVANKVAFDKNKGFARSWDNQTYWQYAANLGRRVSSIESRINSYRFKPTLMRERNVKWKKRILYLSTWEDKIVETWLSMSLNRLLSGWFSGHSYAYRLDKLGVDLCQKNVVRSLRSSRFVAKRDIKSFFYSIDQEILLGKLAGLVDDKLLQLLRQRVEFSYYVDGEVKQSEIGVPFGSPIACLLANIYLTSVDKILMSGPVHYFRYADDFLLTGDDPAAVLEYSELLATEMVRLKMELHKVQNVGFDRHPSFELVNRFKYLGLEYTADGLVRFPIEKKRKITNIFRRVLSANKRKVQKQDGLPDRLRAAVSYIREATLERIRQAAIIDYYLKHVDDDKQLKVMDREIAEMVVSVVLGKSFRARDFRTVSYRMLREYGLPSLLHRSRLHRHGHLHVPFLSLYNGILIERYEEGRRRRLERIGQIGLARKSKLLEG